MHGFLNLLFALAAGLTLSGIVANLYRLLARRPRGRLELFFYCGVMALAGPSVLLENATRSFRARDCTPTAYGFAMAIAGYWALVLGLMLLDVRVALAP